MPHLPACHMIAPFHTVLSETASHCAFTGKTLRFEKMMRDFFPGGYFEYANEGSESEAQNKIVLLKQAEMEKCYPRKPHEFWGNHATIGSDGWNMFDARLRVALTGRVRTGDFICHPFGRAHVQLFHDYPFAIHVETGIGYPDAPFGAFRIYESWAWAHSHWGRWGQAGLGGECPEAGDALNPRTSWVIPNYFDLDEWPIGKLSSKKIPYAMFMGRITEPKGLPTLGTVIRAWIKKHGPDRLHFVVAGQGDWTPYEATLVREAPSIRFLGPIEGRERAKWIGGAAMSLMPTKFIEPFGGSGVEGLLCGTPLIASDWGAFTETIQIGRNGYRCRTIGDWIAALEHVLDGTLLSREQIAKEARARYSLEACRVKYAKVFGALLELRHGKGEMSLESTLWETP